jgi:pyocin large subunit-like protein
MNYKAMEWAFEQPLADSSAKFLLVAIAGHAGRDLSCFPSYNRLSKMTGMSVRTLNRKVIVLQDAGLIKVTTRKRPNGSFTSSEYVLLMNQPDANLSPPSRQNGMTTQRDNTNNINTTSIVSSSASDKLADGGIDWAAMAAEAMKGK